MTAKTPSAAEITALQDTELTVGQLLEMFGVRVRRPADISRIDTALAAAGLSTEPVYHDAASEVPLRFVVAAPADTAVAAASGPGKPVPAEEQPSTLPMDRMRLSAFESARSGLVSAKPGDSLQSVVLTMMKYKYSQIPVIDELYRLHGIVSWGSIGRMYATGSKHDLLCATDPNSPVTEVGTTLESVMPWIQEHGFCIVRDEYGQLTGIVTASDVAARFEQISRPFFLIGTIERGLRDRLRPVFSGTQIAKAGAKYKGKPSDRIDHLMFGGYVKLLTPEVNWKALNWHGVPQADFLDDLRHTGHVRNEVMHFDRTLEPARLEQLNRFADLIHSIPNHHVPDVQGAGATG
ncbi:CBS domain-containing protein [Nocardia sp. NPDC127579]|uniref:CBS domain-containing protein n=1 Tax=Nocardia sp. NPDC127579 TaxID=3345402 RepID=UPI00362DB082